MSKPTPQTNFDSNDKLAVFLRLVSYLKPYWWAAIFMVFGMILSAGSEVASAKLFEFIIDAINHDDEKGKFWFPFLVIALFFSGHGGIFGGILFSVCLSQPCLSFACGGF